LACPSTVFNLFHCANASNFSQDNFDGKTEAYKQAFQFIGVMRPQLPLKPAEPGDLRLACWNVTSYSWDAPRHVPDITMGP